jgi:Zn-dependent membrane protease YugP
MIRVYNYMAAAVALTGVVAWFTFNAAVTTGAGGALTLTAFGQSIFSGPAMIVLVLATLGLVFFGAAVLFTFVTLPVEFGASRRALAFVEPMGLIGERGDGARAVLKAAGWTYVAAALTALLTFLYYVVLIFGGNRR